MEGSVKLPEEQSIRDAKPHMLVVDDDSVVRALLVEALQSLGCSVDACGDGVSALARTAQKDYDLIITDLKLPGLSGLDLIKRLKELETDTDVIVITGYASIENAVECMKAGAVDYLVKPIIIDQIQVAVKKVLEHRELARKAEYYRQLAYVDGLTGVFNRRYFDENLELEVRKALAERTSMLLIMIDLDDFGAINKMHGHQKGDEALRRIGEILKSVCRGYDIVCRYGGDEFAIILPSAKKGHALEPAERILSRVRAAVSDSGGLSVSIGVAGCPDDAEDADTLLRCCNLAMMEAKHDGKNRINVFDETMLSDRSLPTPNPTPINEHGTDRPEIDPDSHSSA